ncbi:MAG: TauD/TfdA family dioxygenase, partial [Pseudomonadota bacterium]
MAYAEAMQVTELKSGFGAEVSGVDVASASDEVQQSLVDVFQKHGALLIRDQNMSPDDLMRFLSAFGEPEDHTQTKFTLPGYPKIYLLSNKKNDKGEPVGAHFDGIGWHTDYSYKEEPVMNTMLYSIEAPAEGGDTLLADCCAKQANLDEVWFVPTANQPLKPAGPQASGAHRLSMLELATADRSEFVSSPVELDRGGVSYTVDTLAIIHA